MMMHEEVMARDRALAGLKSINILINSIYC